MLARNWIKFCDQKSIKLIFSDHNLTKLRTLLILIFTTFCLSFLFNPEPVFAQETSSFNPQKLLIDALQWIDNLGTIGAIAFIFLYIIATVIFLPGSILTLGAGVIFGIVLGSIYVFIGATLGATLAFLIGRYLARNWIAQKIEGNQQFKAIDQAVGKQGLKIVFLTRLSPIFPFNLLNYAYGLTKVTLIDYMIASVGMIPGTIMYVYIGSLVGNLAMIGSQIPTLEVNPLAQWTIRIIGLIATLTVTIYITKIAKKALDESVLELND